MFSKGQIFTTDRGRTVRFMNLLNGDKEKRWGGVVYDVCKEEKYYMKCIDSSKRKIIPGSQIACLRREALLVEKLAGTYQYLLVPCDTAKVGDDRCVFYPFKGESWNSFWEAESNTRYKADMLFKEKLFLKILYAVKEYADKGYVHRDLKPGNITLEIQEDGEVTPHIIDFDWMYIDQEFEREINRKQDMKTAYPGGTEGYGHPLSFRRNTDNEVLKAPSLRWDFYSLAMIAYALFEDTSHFVAKEEKEWNPITDSNDGGERYWNNDTIGFTLREMKHTEKILGNPEVMQVLRNILQKMMGHNSEYEGQYFSIDEIISDYKGYLKKHYRKQYCRLFECKGSNCAECECTVMETRHFCIQIPGIISETRHYALQKNKLVIIRVEGEELLEVGWDKIGIVVKVLDDEWEWKSKYVLRNKFSDIEIKVAY